MFFLPLFVLEPKDQGDRWFPCLLPLGSTQGSSAGRTGQDAPSQTLHCVSSGPLRENLWQKLRDIQRARSHWLLGERDTPRPGSRGARARRPEGNSDPTTEPVPWRVRCDERRSRRHVSGEPPGQSCHQRWHLLSAPFPLALGQEVSDPGCPPPLGSRSSAGD